MIEQRTIIDHKVIHILYHHGVLDKREEYILKPTKINGVYEAFIPNVRLNYPIIVNKDTEIKVVYFQRKR